MATPCAVGVVVLLEPFQGVLANHFEHAHPRLAVGALGHRDQADILQLGHQVQRIGSGRIIAVGQGHLGQRAEVAAPANTLIRRNTWAAAGSSRS